MFSSQTLPRHLKGKSVPTASDPLSYLGVNERMAALLPAVKRIAAIQQACAAIVPDMFGPCAVLHFHSGQLLLAVPNAALSARLKQRLPRLQDELLRQGWQVDAIRLKIQMTPAMMEQPPAVKTPQLPGGAVSALAELKESLEDTPRNAALRAAIAAMVNRHRRTMR
jgi:hypothetical protein